MKKIPDHAKKVFEGIIFDVYHWNLEMYDGTTGLFEAVKKRSSVSVIAVVGDEVLINDEEQPHLGKFVSLPGGMSEKESVDSLSDAKRELSEETGYESSSWELFYSLDPFTHPKIEGNITVYIARNAYKVANPKLDPGEKITTRLITFDEFLELRHNPKFRSKDLIPYLEKAANFEEEKQKLKDLLGITT